MLKKLFVLYLSAVSPCVIAGVTNPISLTPQDPAQESLAGAESSTKPAAGSATASGQFFPMSPTEAKHTRPDKNVSNSPTVGGRQASSEQLFGKNQCDSTVLTD